MTRSDLSFRILRSDKEGMMPKVIGLLFFALVAVGLLPADDYVVAKGDTATSIAQKAKLSIDVLQRANPDAVWSKLKVGDHLTLPDRYTVKAGDTLYSLCRAWGVDQAAVLALNDLSGPAALKTGQTLFLPPKAKSRPTATPSVTPTVAPTLPPSSVFWPVERTPHPEGDKLKAVTFSTAGEAFRSVSSGTVAYVGEFRGVGRVLLVQGVDKTVFAYGNFESAAVEFGQTVSRGQTLGQTSSRNSQKLYFFAFRQTDPLDVFTAKR